ncbi:MAG: PaaI family thioesterase [Deltaproteobacteria bacterium]|nr:PaaI family thioesterase [Deltaproteobacteria bacterium]
MPALPDLTDLANQYRGPFTELTGLVFTHVVPGRVEAALALSERHHQPYGMVHGGVHATIVETLCSVGAGITVALEGKSAVGLENHTSFVRAVRSGTLHAVAEPLHPGKRTQVWRCEIRDDDGNLAAYGTMRVMILPKGAAAGGEVVAVKHGPTGS